MVWVKESRNIAKSWVKFLCFFSSRRRHTRWNCDWSSDVCSSDLYRVNQAIRSSTVFEYTDALTHGNVISLNEDSSLRRQVTWKGGTEGAAPLTESLASHVIGMTYLLGDSGDEKIVFSQVLRWNPQGGGTLPNGTHPGASEARTTTVYEYEGGLNGKEASLNDAALRKQTTYRGVANNWEPLTGKVNLGDIKIQSISHFT